MHDCDLGQIQNETTVIIFVLTKEVFTFSSNLLLRNCFRAWIFLWIGKQWCKKSSGREIVSCRVVIITIYQLMSNTGRQCVGDLHVDYGHAELPCTKINCRSRSRRNIATHIPDSHFSLVSCIYDKISSWALRQTIVFTVHCYGVTWSRNIRVTVSYTIHSLVTLGLLFCQHWHDIVRNNYRLLWVLC